MKTGVYQIRNLLNSKLYIGSAAGQGFNNRWGLHLKQLVENKHHSRHLQRAWNKYGLESFIFEILELCKPSLCLEREQHYLDTVLFANCNDQRFHELGYNICRVAGSMLGVKRSKEFCERISLRNRGEGHRLAKITEGDVVQILILASIHNKSQKSIGEQFNVSGHNINSILRGNSWRHVVLPTWLIEPVSMMRQNGRYANCSRPADKNPMAKFSLSKMKEIKLVILSGQYRGRDIAKQYDLSESHVSSIKHNRRWRDV